MELVRPAFVPKGQGGYNFLRRLAMVKEMTIGETLALFRRKVARGKRAFTQYIPPHKIPPFRPFATHEVPDQVAGVVYDVYVRPNPQDGGWLLKVKVREQPFNPALPPELAEKLRK